MSQIALRPMAQEEFEPYVAWSVRDYAEEVQRNTGVDEAAALRRAERSFHELLPDGLTTRGHELLIAADDRGERIGHLWVARQERDGVPVLWINDIFIEAATRGKGYGRRLMELAEERARELGIRRMELNVYGDNERARRLYASLGYVEMSRQLYKDLGPA